MPFVCPQRAVFAANQKCRGVAWRAIERAHGCASALIVRLQLFFGSRRADVAPDEGDASERNEDVHLRSRAGGLRETLAHGVEARRILMVSSRNDLELGHQR